MREPQPLFLILLTMKTFRRTIFLALLLPVLSSCGGKVSKTTDGDSRRFPTLSEKQAFLERYVSFRRRYDELDFAIRYIDGGDGMVPGPTEWDVRILAKVPMESLDEWASGMVSTQIPDVSWVSSIPNAPIEMASFEWYSGEGRIVGISRGNRLVLYRSRGN